MNLPLKIAKRYLFAKKSTNAINIISMVSALGMCVAVGALILILSVFNGLESLVTSLYNTFNPDLKITPKQGKVFLSNEEQFAALQAVDGVETVALVLEEMGVLRYDDKITPCRLKGVDENFLQVAGVDDLAMLDGEFIMKEKEAFRAVVGLGIQRALRISLLDEFEKLEILMPKRKGKMTSSNPERAFNFKSVYPSGVFSIQEEFDREYVFIALPLIRQLLEYDENYLSQFEVKIKAEADPKDVKEKLLAILGPGFEVKTRFEQDEFLYKIMKSEKLVVFLILTLILAVAAFNIIGSLSMLVIEKTKDIAILRSMGADSGLIKKIFLIEGFLLSFLGGVIGMGIAFVVCFIQQKFEILKIQGDSLLIDAYPIEMRLSDFVLVLFTIIVISIIAAWFPANRASKQDGILKGA